MDGLLTAALSSLPQLSGAGLLVLFVILLLRREGQELARERSAHDAELAEKDAEIAAQRARAQAAEQMIDDERKLRRMAEDISSKMSRHRLQDADTVPG